MRFLREPEILIFEWIDLHQEDMWIYKKLRGRAFKEVLLPYFYIRNRAVEFRVMKIVAPNVYANPDFKIKFYYEYDNLMIKLQRNDKN